MESQNASSSTLPNLFESVTGDNPKYMPVAPYDMEEYRKMTARQRESLAEKFFAREDIKAYQEAKWKAELHNRDCFIWLWEVYSGKWGDHGQNDPIKRHALEVKMEQFEKAILSNENPFISLALDFSKYPYKHTKEKTVAWDD